MKRVLWTLFAVLLTPAVASANVRAPIEMDGDLVIAKLAKEATANVALKHQRLVVALPKLVEKEFPTLQAKIKATYTFENAGDAVTVPMVFLATNIHDAVVTVNGKRIAGPTDVDMNDAQRDELKQAVGKYAPPPRHRADDPFLGKSAAFEMKLAQGKNTVVFQYRQAVRFDENGTRYGGPKHDRSTMSLNYLLYPCKEWNQASDFELDVVVQMPDFVKDGWFWDTLWKPDIQTNLALKPSYDKKARLTTLRGSFKGYPENVLSVNVRRGEKR